MHEENYIHDVLTFTLRPQGLAYVLGTDSMLSIVDLPTKQVLRRSYLPAAGEEFTAVSVARNGQLVGVGSYLRSRFCRQSTSCQLRIYNSKLALVAIAAVSLQSIGSKQLLSKTG